MDSDAALMRAWNLGDGKGGWSNAVMEEAELLLPTLLEAGYAYEEQRTWNFTEKGIARAMAIEREGHEPTS